MKTPPVQDPTLELLELADNYNEWLLARAEPYVRGRVLDFGAGIGTFSVRLAPLADELLALEPDDAFGARLARRLAPFPHARRLAHDDLEPESVDTIVCFNVLEHIADDAATLARFRELLRPGGHALVLVPGHPFLYGAADRALAHERRYGKGELEARAEGAGFHVAEARRVNPVGALGWLLWSRVLGREQLPVGPTRMYDRLVPLFRALDSVALPLGLSVWAVLRRR